VNASGGDRRASLSNPAATGNRSMADGGDTRSSQKNRLSDNGLLVTLSQEFPFERQF